ncbi:hypothetical protein RHGRI_012766 [Rhododendron griersonianum]|uniref:Uncharacterized protein n=1 Tax=Rhododendron griersonianum TaxID=479676 RepID=A0AAV6KRT3_9ERIC|nr:hypothetical protein RHGRI_012766 [Rhododendron griersonianum]
MRRLFSQYRRASLEDDKKGIEFALYLELSNVNIPDRVKYSVIDEVVSFAHSMVEEKDAHHNKEEEEEKKMVFPIVVDIVVKNLQRPSESDPEAISRALSDMIGDVKIPPCVDRREFIKSFIACETALAKKRSRERCTRYRTY